jgi:hypothetical protein
MKYYLCRCKCGYEEVFSEEELKAPIPPPCSNCEPEKYELYKNNNLDDICDCHLEQAG